MEQRIREAILEALEDYGVFEEDFVLELDRPKDSTHGDLSTNVALVLAKRLARKPRELAGEIAARLALDRSLVAAVEIAGPGFINFRLAHGRLVDVVAQILQQGERYGESNTGQGQRVNVEFISANPTGPLNIVSARAAAVGAALVRAMATAGYRPQSEFYVNDAGRQVELLGESLRARYAQLLGRDDVAVPEGGYQGEYLVELARRLAAEEPGAVAVLRDAAAGRIAGTLPQVQGTPDEWLALPPAESARAFGRYAFCALLAGQRATCVRYGVEFDTWTLESSMHVGDRLQRALAALRERGHVYEHEGAQWFRSTTFGDEKDRVVVKKDGEPTYFLTDIAYHADKHQRAFERVIDFWGPDHHGHVARMAAAMQALGYAPDWLEIVILQQVNLILDGKPLEMSKRAGRLVTMDELIAEVGADVAKFFFLARKNTSHMDFDLDLARSQSNENPGWYVKYAHARICSVLRNSQAQGRDLREASAADLALLTHDAELALLRLLPELPDAVARAAASRELARLTALAVDVATAFHQFYHQCKILTDEEPLAKARVALSRATQIVLANTLRLLGIEAPERM
jgi:arginyl-tRNA synthetase